MRYLVLSDVHANLPALEAVLADAGEFDAALNLGDLVGYGPHPNEVVERVRELPNLTSLAGNHDLAALRRLDLNLFNPYARFAAEWTDARLDPGTRHYLESLTPSMSANGFRLAHASMRDPVWEYMETAGQAPPNFALFDEPVGFVGHTHVPRVFTESGSYSSSHPAVQLPEAGAMLDVQDSSRRIVNPGGVGQPRNGDPRAAYGLLDTDAGRFEFRRVAYPIRVTQAAMIEGGLPAPLAARLAHGR